MIIPFRFLSLCSRQHAGAVILVCLFVFTITSSSYAARTVDADGGSNYTSISAALTFASSGDTIYIQGSDIDTYTENWSGITVGNVTIRGAATNPDSFPIITVTDWANWWNNNTGTRRFERIVLSNCASIPLQNTLKYIIIDKCIVKSFTSPVFDFTNFGQSNAITITNTIFWGNSTTIFPAITMNRNVAMGTVFNSTFYNNTTVNADNPAVGDTARTLKIHNSIFNSNGTNITGTYLKAICSYNLTNESSGWGTGSVYNISNPGFNSASPSKASDFGLQSGSAARDVATSTGAPTQDIAGTSRSGQYDIGAWEGSGGSGTTYYTWDTSSTAGVQGGDGTWSTVNANWTATGGDGTTLVNWPGSGNSATFAGGSRARTVTISGSVSVDSISFLDSTYTLQGGTSINFGTKRGIYVAAGKKAIISTPLTGAAGINKSGSGALILNGSNTYGGVTTISDGLLQLTGNGGIPDGSTVSLANVNGAVLNLNNTVDTVGAISGGGTDGGNIDLGGSSGHLFCGGNHASTTYGGIISNSGSFTKLGTGPLTLTGDNTFTGSTYLRSGTLRIGLGGTTGSLTGNIVIDAYCYLYFNRSNDWTYAGSISGSANVRKQGTGTLTLSGTSSFGGGFTVESGTLLVTASLSSASQLVSSGATLGGTGSLNGLTMTVSGAISPGTTGTGILTFNHSTSVTCTSNAQYIAMLNGTIPGSGYDQLRVTNCPINFGNATLSLSLGYAPSVNDAFVIIDNTSSNTNSGTFSGHPEGSTIALGYSGTTYLFTISYSGGTGNDVVLTCQGILVADNYNVWNYSRTLRLNTTSSGANIQGNVLNFPVLLRLEPSTFPNFYQTSDGGRDIRFAKNDGTHLKYTIERWIDVIGNNDTAEIWIKLDTVYGNNSTQSFKMYWGNPSAADSSNAPAIFSTDNNFAAVWHMNENPADGNGAIKDATSNANNATPGGGMTSSDRVKGQIGNGTDFDGTDDGLTISNSSSLSISSAITISAWINARSTDQYRNIYSKPWTSNSDPYLLHALHFDNASHLYGLITTGSTRHDVIGTTVVPTNQFIFAVFTYDGTTLKLFYNGSQEGNTTTHSGSIATNTQNSTIGKDGFNNSQSLFDGILDEVTVSNTARSADWIKLCYENQKPEQTLIDPEDYTTWDHSGNIKINTSGITTTNCVGFPLLIRLTSSNFYFSEAQSAGQDIRFSKSDGTPLPYQIERWDNTIGYAEIWVRVDTVFGNNSSQYIVMYWGKNYVGSKSNSTAVFNATNGFMGSWHFGGNIADATGYNTASDIGSVDTLSGLIGRARAFNGAQLIQLGDIADRSSGTISFWMRPKAAFGSSTTTSQGIWGKTENDNYNSTIALRGTEYSSGDGSAGSIQCKVENNGSFVYVSGTTTSFTAGTWYYVTFNYGSSSSSMYLNGTVQKTTGSSQTVAGTASDEVGRAYFDNGNISGAGPRYFNGTLDEFRMESEKRSADWIRLCYETQRSDQSIISIPGNYTWDISTSTDIQPGNGIWSTSNNNWTVNGTTLVPWPGAGNTAIFAGADGSYTITLSGKQNVDSITFKNSGYKITGDTINFGTKKGIYLHPGKSDTINSIISGTGGLSVRSTTTLASLYLGGTNNYTGVTTIGAYTRINAPSLANGGTVSPIGASSSAAANLVFNGGQLQLGSGSSSTDRLFTVTENGASIFSSGSGAMNFTNTGSVAYSGSGNRTIEFGGSYSGANTFAPVIGNGSGGTTSILKTGGTSTWLITGNNTFTGTVSISSGILRAGSASAFGNTSNTISVSNTGAIDINGYNLQSYTGITINGTLLGTFGAIYNSGAEQQNALRQITLGSDASIGNDGNRFDIGRGFTGNRIFGNGYIITKVGTGTITFAADATNLGGLVINGGTVILETNASAGTAPITIGTNGTLSSDGSRNFTNQITFNNGGAITTPNNASYTTSYNSTVAASGTITLNTVTTNSLTLGGVVSGTGTINKLGTGTLILSNTNTYTGNVNINSGTLRVTGSTVSGSTVAVASGATLSGTGNVQGTVTVANSGIIAPGITGAGVLSTGALTLNNASVLNYDLGATSDTIKVNGNLTLDGTLNITFTGTPGTYTLITYTGTLTNNTISLGTVPAGYIYAIAATDGKVTLDILTRELLPITVNHNIGTGTSDTCLVYTNNWSLIFDEDEGGQIRFLSNQANGAGTNQMSTGTQRNMFSVQFNQGSYDVTGTLKILEIGSAFTTIENTYTLSNVTFTEEYTIDGSGRIYLKVKAQNTSGSVQTQPLSFLTFRDEIGSAHRITSTATASTCTYLLNAESFDANQFDIIFSLYDLWTDATAFVSSTSDYSCLGLTDNSYSFANNTKRVWEFMIDFSSKNCNDTSATTRQIVNDYRNPDSLAFITGTLGMEQTWEHHLYGHWKFDETGGDTARDNSASSRHLYTNGTFSSGKWGNGLLLNGSQRAIMSNPSALSGMSRFTITAWIKTQSFGTTETLIGKHDNSNGWKVTGNDYGQVTIHCNGITRSGTTEIEDDAWHHVAVSYSFWDQNIMIFVDGKLDAYHIGSFPVSANIADLVIGQGLSGRIDDVRYYDEQVSESTMKSIYQLGFRSATGSYHLRADNNNTVHFVIDGGTTMHYFPSFTIENYWATAKPSAGCVVLNGTALTENTHYYAYIDDHRNTLKIILNKVISTDGAYIYIDDNNSDGYQMVGATKKMSWGVNTLGTNKYVWVKNFPTNTFGDNTSNQWYINWNMGTSGSAQPSRDGEIWYMASSVEKANTAIDTTSSNLIPGSNMFAYNSTMGNVNFTINSSQVRSSENVSNSFSYQIAESSSVRVRLRVNERQVINTQSYLAVTEWTIYPTGQIFRFDSLYQFSAAPSKLYMGWFMRDQTNATIYSSKKVRKRAAVIYSSGYPDFAGAWLSMRNASGYQPEPFDSDTIGTVNDSYRVGFDFYDGTLSSAWNSTSIQTAVYCDMSSTSMTTSTVDSICRAVQTIGLANGAALAIIEGSLVTNSNGDLNADGFNEREGAYVIEADNNTVNFKLPARNDTCRFTPAFKIRNYYASRKPNYVFGYNATDTMVLLDGYQYNAYLNQSSRELVMQFDSVFCDSAGIYISADKTLAVSISEFLAISGILSDTIRWQTESEQENLGFHIYRRIKPAFIDSIKNVILNTSPQTSLGRAGTLVKSRTIDTADTQWVRITKELIPGAPAGASVGPRMYQFIDCEVFDSLIYEYRLKAIDFENRNRIYGPVNAMPFTLIKYMFTLGRNYPNPFKGYTVIQFTLPEQLSFSLDIYDLQGRLIRQLIRKDKPYNAGMYRVIWDGANSSGNKTAAGTYIYHLNSKKYKKAFTMLYTGR